MGQLHDADNTRDGNTAGWPSYWNWSGSDDQPTPRHEALCRDALLPLLRARLETLGVDAQPEGLYADDKRADIRVCYGKFNVPVEIKNSSHRELLSAVRIQLIHKYTRDPCTDGYGVYLVFWFGKGYVQMPPSGGRPLSARELGDRLRSGLSPDERLKISIVVIDVANAKTGRP